MPNRIKKFAANFLLGDEVRKLNEATQLMANAYLRGPFELPPEVLISQLKEYDSTLLYDMVMQLGYDQIGGAYTGYLNDASERTRAVKESQRLWKYDVLASWMIQTWTNFGFGENIEIIPMDENAKEVWEEYWYAEENQIILSDDEIQSLSEEGNVNGEIFFVYYISQLNGKVQVSVIDPLEIAEIIVDKTNPYKKLLYKRQYSNANNTTETLYYIDISVMNDPDMADEFIENAYFHGGETLNSIKNKLAHKVKEDNTFVCVQHVPFNRKSRKMLRGWPLLTAGAPWIRESNRFEEHRATLAAAVAMIVNKVKVDAGSRGVKDIRSAIASTLSATNAIEGNPPPVGGTMVHNKAVDVDRMPLTTGGSDSKFDRDGIGRMAALGGGLLAPYVGLGDYSRLATSTQMETPMLRGFSRYQRFWASQFQKMVWVVLRADELWGNRTEYETYEADVSTDRLVETDLKEVSTSVSKMLKDGLQPYVDSGIISREAANLILAAIWRIALQALNIEDAEELTDEEHFTMEDEMDDNSQAANGNQSAPDDNMDDTKPVEACGGGGSYKRSTGKRKGKRKASVSKKRLQEVIDPDTNKFIPAITAFVPEEPPKDEIDAEDIQAAITNWDATKPPELRGILAAQETKKAE